MGHSQAEKARSRARIATVAARRLREGGTGSFNISDVMSDAQLTHGGFYGHFPSKTDLIAVALHQALAESRVANSAPSDQDSLESIVGGYLSASHRDAPGGGCAVAALGSEVARAEPATRRVMADHLERYFAGIADVLARGGDPSLAIPVVCTMVGALTLSRLVDQAALSDQVLADAEAFILATAAASGTDAARN